jgi:hypothetical protein
VSAFSDIQAIVEQGNFTVYSGYAPTGAKLPYTVHRPLVLNEEASSVAGVVIDWDYQSTLYACAESVEASWNLAVALMQALSGKPAGGTTLSTSMGYSGAPVEGHYESQVTVQLNQGGI